MQIMYAFPDIGHSGIQRLFQLQQRGFQGRILVYHTDGTCHQDRAGEHMPYIVMYLPGDAVALFQGGSVYFIILLFKQRVILLFQQQIQLRAVVPCLLKPQFKLLVPVRLETEEQRDAAAEHEE